MAKEDRQGVSAKTYQDSPDRPSSTWPPSWTRRYKRLPFLSTSRAAAGGEPCAGGGQGPPWRKPKTSTVAEDKAATPPRSRHAKKPAPRHSAPRQSSTTCWPRSFCPPGRGGPGEERHAVREELSNFKLLRSPWGLNEDPPKWWSDRLALFPARPKVLQKYWAVAAVLAPERRLARSPWWERQAQPLGPRARTSRCLYENARGGAGTPAGAGRRRGEWGAWTTSRAFALGEAALRSASSAWDGSFV